MNHIPVAIHYADDTLSIEFSYSTESTTHADILEEIFAGWNNGSGQESEIFLRREVRSLSVGDYVRVDGQWYACAPVGWREEDEADKDLWFSALGAIRAARLPGSDVRQENHLRWSDKRKLEDARLSAQA